MFVDSIVTKLLVSLFKQPYLKDNDAFWGFTQNLSEEPRSPSLQFPISEYFGISWFFGAYIFALRLSIEVCNKNMMIFD